MCRSNVYLPQTLTNVRNRSRALEAEDTVTLSLVLPVLRKLLGELEPAGRDTLPCALFKADLRRTIIDRFESVFKTACLPSCASALDPRTSNAPNVFEDDDTAVSPDEVWKALAVEAQQLNRDPSVTPGMLVFLLSLFFRDLLLSLFFWGFTCSPD